MRVEGTGKAVPECRQRARPLAADALSPGIEPGIAVLGLVGLKLLLLMLLAKEVLTGSRESGPGIALGHRGKASQGLKATGAFHRRSAAGVDRSCLRGAEAAEGRLERRSGDA